MFQSHTLPVLASLVLLSACGGIDYEDDGPTDKPPVERPCDELGERACLQRDDCAPTYDEVYCATDCDELDCYMVECPPSDFYGCEELPEPPDGCLSDADCAPNQECIQYYADPVSCLCAPCLSDDPECGCDCPAPPPSGGECVDRGEQECFSDADCGPGFACEYEEWGRGADCACEPCAEDQLCDPCDCGAPAPVGYCVETGEPASCDTDADCSNGERCEYIDAACDCAPPPCDGDDDCEDWDYDCGCGGQGICLSPEP